VIGHDVAGRIDNDAGAETLQRLPDLMRTPAIITKKLRVKIFDWIAHRASNDSLGVDVNHRRQNFRDRQDRRFSSRIGLSEARCRSCHAKRANADQYQGTFPMSSHLGGASNEAAAAASTCCSAQ